MSRALKVALILAAGIFASLTLAHLWVTHPDRFPTLPESLWKAFDAFYGSRNGEELADLEFLVVFVASSIVVTFFIGAVTLALRLIRTNPV